MTIYNQQQLEIRTWSVDDLTSDRFRVRFFGKIQNRIIAQD